MSLVSVEALQSAHNQFALYAFQTDSFIRQIDAIVVIGGLLSSTLLTLVLVPVVYAFFSGERTAKPVRSEQPV